MLISVETEAVRLAGLRQLKVTLAHHQRVLIDKLCQMNALTPSSEENLTDHGISSDARQVCRRMAIEDTILTKGQLRFDDVAGLQEAKQILKEAIIMPLQFPQLFTGGRKPWKRILLFGPPGTGKSRLAQAVSSEIHSTFYCVSSSDLISSFIGESEKLIKQLFQHATNQQGRSVIFIDEIDSICRARSSKEEEYTRRIKTELLKQMEGADTTLQASNIFLMCATNCPWELDVAFLRRFQKRIYIPLPDREARLSLLKLHIGDCAVRLSDQEWEEMAEKTDGYSGSDIATVVLGALFQPIRNLQISEYWKYTSDGKVCPCEKDCPDAFHALMSDLPSDDVQPRDVSVDDFVQSLTMNKNTVSACELDRFENFTKTYGQAG
ncbi:Suppressor protein of bem1/bed5 double mutants [Lamellibrachia satsuma]|nr:Suppressor protein of bem1/bed5 double mutants [Lamellibrachia satsuma]